jgi:hypothetical protein
MSQRSLGFCFRISPQAVSRIVRETLSAIVEALKDEHLSNPTAESIQANAEAFKLQWNFPNAVGAIDGKHVRVRAPWNSGSLYHNYKNFFSVVLLSLVDANYKFVAVDIGTPGSQSDSGILHNSALGHQLQEILGSTQNEVEGFGLLPFVILGDEGFQLKPWLMRPYPGDNLPSPAATFNYRLSRARRVVENAFGILSARWRIFHSVIDSNLSLVNDIVFAAVVLHNYLIDVKDKFDPTSEGRTLGSSFDTLVNRGAQNHSNMAKQVRDDYATFFSSEQGSVNWQSSHVLRGYE